MSILAIRIFQILSVLIALYPLVYLISDVRFGLLTSKSEELLADNLWNVAFYSHIGFGGVALGVGWLQFISNLRNTRRQLHRIIGFIYVATVVLSGLAGIYVGFSATGGFIASVGFVLLGVVWLSTTLLAFRAAKNGDFTSHEVLMIYSYAACFAAVTLRIWLPLLTVAFGDFMPAYRTVAWLCWVPNIIVAYWIVKRKRTASIMLS